MKELWVSGSTYAKEEEPKRRYWHAIDGVVGLIKEELWAGKDAVEELKKGLDRNKCSPKMVNFMGIAIICSGIVPDNELWLIQDGKLIQKYVVERR